MDQALDLTQEEQPEARMVRTDRFRKLEENSPALARATLDCEIILRNPSLREH